MEKKLIHEQNKLMAEFMGYTERIENRGKYFDVNYGKMYNGFADTRVYDHTELLSETLLSYHKDWNKLMEVVNRIEAIKGVIVDIHREATKIKFYINDVKEWTTTMFDQEVKINHVYKAVIEFIKWHNTNTPTNLN